MTKSSSLLTAALYLLSAAVWAQSPVHVALKASSPIAASADGFFTLGQIADLSGGESAMRTRMAAVPVGRVPLAGATRRLAWGDVALKLRQAGFHPDKDALREGASQVIVMAPPAPNNGGAREEAPAPLTFSSPAPPLLGAGGATLLIHRGDTVTILVQSGALTITARGVAREGGAAGATIRVHREGVMADLSVTVLDAQTVQLEL